MKIFNLLILVAIILVNGCNKIVEEVKDPREYLKNGLNLEDYIDKEEIVVLDDNAESLISFPYLMICNANYYIISSRNQTIKLFTRKGKYFRNIGAIGDGPGEYRDIQKIIKVGEDKVGVYDSFNQRFTLYDMNGKVLFDKILNLKIAIGAKSLYYFDNKYYVQTLYTKDEPFQITVLNSELNKVNSFINADKNYEGFTSSLMFNGGMYLDENAGILYEANSFSNNIVNMINLATNEIKNIPVKNVSFFQKKPELKEYIDHDSRLKLFNSTCHILAVYPIKNMFIISYSLPFKTHNIVINVLYNPATERNQVVREVPPDYYDGKYFYKIEISTDIKLVNSRGTQQIKICSYKINELTNKLK